MIQHKTNVANSQQRTALGTKSNSNNNSAVFDDYDDEDHVNIKMILALELLDLLKSSDVKLVASSTITSSSMPQRRKPSRIKSFLKEENADVKPVNCGDGNSKKFEQTSKRQRNRRQRGGNHHNYKKKNKDRDNVKNVKRRQPELNKSLTSLVSLLEVGLADGDETSGGKNKKSKDQGEIFNGNENINGSNSVSSIGDFDFDLNGNEFNDESIKFCLKNRYNNGKCTNNYEEKNKNEETNTCSSSKRRRRRNSDTCSTSNRNCKAESESGLKNTAINAKDIAVQEKKRFEKFTSDLIIIEKGINEKIAQLEKCSKEKYDTMIQMVKGLYAAQGVPFPQVTIDIDNTVIDINSIEVMTETSMSSISVSNSGTHSEDEKAARTNRPISKNWKFVDVMKKSLSKLPMSNLRKDSRRNNRNYEGDDELEHRRGASHWKQDLSMSNNKKGEKNSSSSTIKLLWDLWWTNSFQQ